MKTERGLNRYAIRFLLAASALLIVTGCAQVQRSLLFHPTHEAPNPSLAAWKLGERVIGYARIVSTPRNVWLLLHGNGGQAAFRGYAMPSFSPDDSVYVVEYPGYGQRPGTPSLESINAAAREAYDQLRAEFPQTPVCVAGESIGSGPACFLATSPRPPDKIVLMVPFAVLRDVAGDHVALLPSRLLIADNWNNVASLQTFNGPLEIFAAKDDTIIPIRHAKALAAAKPQTAFHAFEGGHNDWPYDGRVSIHNP